jgi:CRP/FNR family cyclic AMP-dependent transcriptional regulator
MNWVEMLGYAAAASVLATFCMRTMIPLRVLALTSNLLFALYGYFDGLHPVLFLHLILFPINLIRLIQFERLVREVGGADRSELTIQSWLPHMKQRKLSVGQTLVHKGDKADSIFYLAQGELDIPELGKSVDAGAVVGEIGVFATNARRMATIVCRTDCRLYELTKRQAKQLFFQDRKFGLAMLQLIIDRLLENNRGLAESSAK